MIRTSEILTSKNHIEPLRDAGYVIYKIGWITPVTEGKREAKMLWGNSKTSTSTEKNRIVKGDFIWLHGLTYAFVNFEYWFGGVLFKIAYQELTLTASDATYGRVDGICVNNIGQGVANAGTPATDPFKPDPDPATQLEFTFAIIPANATEPEGVTDVVVFDEHTVDEFTPSTVGVTVDFDNTTAPYSGSKCASVGAIGTNDTIKFTHGTALNHDDFETLIQSIKLKVAASNSHKLFVRFMLAGVSVTNEIAVPFNISLLTWQTFVLQLSAFTWSNAQFDAVQFRWNKTGAQSDFTGFYLDYVKLQTGISPLVVADTVELTGDVIASGKTGTPIAATLKTVNSNVGSFGSATKTVSITVDAKGRITAISENDITGGTGQTPEFSTVGGWFVWRYVGDPDWIQLFQIPQDGTDGRGIASIVLHSTVGKVKTYRITFTDATTFDFEVTDGADGTGGGGGGSISEIVEIYIDFVDNVPFTYTCPFDLRFTELEYEGSAPALSVALNTDMTKYQDITITPNGTGLVILKGAIASYFAWEVYIEFEIAGETTYKCPYALKFTAMEHEQANAPTLSKALNTNLAKYEALTITADAPGLVTLTGIKL